ncbi:MAG TPA: acyltransferase [Candidatus Limnocylindria bacterium]|jgi:peptidoglycan/LPS O-acetylase OafA/YrhL|nr:acyltransferase [Candidatus Limnocylindria bacterium]
MSGLTHYRYIDALRGFAFLCVLTVHASLQVPGLPGASLTAAGKYGVQLFFLLSAVTLLRSVAVRSNQEQSPIRNFLIRRFFRIAPLFWCGIVLYFLLDGFAPRFWAPHGIGFWHLASTALFLHGWSPLTISSVVPGGWSIAVEMTFYLCLPFLAKRVRSAWSALSLVFFTLVGSVFLEWLVRPRLTAAFPPAEEFLAGSFLYYWFPAQLPVFLAGFVVYFALQSEALKRLLAVPGRPALLAIMALAALVGLSGVQSTLIPRDIFYVAAFSALILALAARPFAAAVNPLTCGLGVISFSCYLTHFAALRAVEHFLTDETFAALPPRVGPVIHFVALWGATLALTAAISTVTYFLIEKPGIRLGSRIIKRLESGTKAA